MGLFAFDDPFAMFDVTPVENQFILEYLPGARGDFVKVYLYGLQQCYHPRKDTGLPVMAQELNLSVEEILSAFRYWERKGLVRRVSDDPPAFQYANVKQRTLTQQALPSDRAYEQFGEALYALFGNNRRLHGKEIAMAYEWVEDMGIPAEVVLMMVQHMITRNGKNFSMKSAQKLAVGLADAKIATVEDAEAFFARDQQVYEGSRQVLRRMGKRREPSEDEMQLYALWITEYGFGPEAVLSACAETTAGEPNFKYLDGILRGIRDRHGSNLKGASDISRAKAKEQEEAAPLKELLRILHQPGLTVNDSTLAIYRDFRLMYPDEMIALAGRLCAPRRADLESVGNMLMKWKDLGLSTQAQVEDYIQQYNRHNAALVKLFQLWGHQRRPGDGDRKMMAAWMEMGFPMEVLEYGASLAREASRPMTYLNRLLTSWHREGAMTLEKAQQAHDATAAAGTRRKGKVVTEQQYDQRADEEDDSWAQWKLEQQAQMKAGDPS